MRRHYLGASHNRSVTGNGLRDDQPAYPRGSSGIGRKLAQRQARNRQITTMLWMTGVMLILGGVVGYGVYLGEDLGPLFESYLQTRQPIRQRAVDHQLGGDLDKEPAPDVGGRTFAVLDQADDDPHPSLLSSSSHAANDGSPLGSVELYPQAQEPQERKIQAQVLATKRWRVVDEPYVSPVHVGPVQIVDEQVVVTDRGRLEFSAQVKTTGDPPVHLATADLALVDFDERIFARREVELVVLNHLQPRQIRVKIPGDLAKRTMRVTSSVRGTMPAPDSIVIQGALVEAIGEGSQTSVRVVVSNPSDSGLAQAHFIVMALNDEKQPLARWRMDWPWPIGPRQQIVFTAQTPVEAGWGVHRWAVVGVGRMGEAGPGAHTTADASS